MTKSQTLTHILTVIDGTSDELLDLLEIKHFDIVVFSEQFDVDLNHDPEMKERYSVGPDDVDFLIKFTGRQIDFDFHKFAYFIEAALKDV